MLRLLLLALVVSVTLNIVSSSSLQQQQHNVDELEEYNWNEFKNVLESQVGDVRAFPTIVSSSSQEHNVDESEQYNWDEVKNVLESQVRLKAFPGCVAIVGNQEGILKSFEIGAHTYEKNATRMSLNGTLFDLASLTKVTTTTTATMQLYEKGMISLNDKVSEYFPETFVSIDKRKEKMTVHHLLVHSAGYAPDPTPSFCSPSMACPEILKPASSRVETFDCRDRIFQVFTNQILDRDPGVSYVYSDSSMITMMYIIGFVARQNNLVSDLREDCMNAEAYDDDTVNAKDLCYYEAYVREHVFRPLLSKSKDSFMGFRPEKSLWARCAPTWNDTVTGFPGECVVPFRNRVLHGEVSDGNAYAMGGVAGHAGVVRLFSLFLS